MPACEPIRSATCGYPRYFRFGRYWVNSYKVFLCVGLYVGLLVSAAAAEQLGLSPLRVGMASLACAVAGLAGARLYHLAVHARHYIAKRSWRDVWNSRTGGWSVFGALIGVVPLSFLLSWILNVSPATFWDCIGGGILAGGFWVRLGCVFNGCCGGRETTGWFGVRLHDVTGRTMRRIPVQFLEMAWWLMGMGGYLLIWGWELPPGSYGLSVVTWYGFGRFWLEPLRESPDLVAGRIRINQVVAGLLTISAGFGLAIRILTS